MRWPVYALSLMVCIFLVGVWTAPVAAADGDESPSSITSFSDTLTDDLLFYPDAFDNTTIELADADGDNTGGSTLGSYLDTFVIDGTAFRSPEIGYGSTDEAWLNITLPGALGIEGVKVCVYAKYVTWTGGHIVLWDSDAAAWSDTFASLTASYTWHNFTSYDPSFFNTDELAIGLIDPGEVSWSFYVDYCEVSFYVMHLADADHYADSFADTSDWTERTATGLGAGDRGFGTDGDVGEFWINLDDTGDEACNWKTVFATPLPKQSYLEYRGYVESATTAPGSVYILKSDLTTGVYIGGFSATMTTYRYYLGAWAALESSIYGVFVGMNDNPNSANSGNYSLFLDYVRVWDSSEEESGWQHDGSITTGVTAGGGGTISTDGDYISLVSDADGSTFDFYIDTTTTRAEIEDSHYHFLSLQFHTGDSTDSFALQSYDGSTLTTLQGTTTCGTTEWHFNVDAVENTVEYFRILGYTSQTLRVDYMKAYSIANWTVTQHGTTPVSHYLYTSGGTLYRVGSSASQYWITVNHDPAISVAQATYQVWNLTASDSDPTARNDWCVQLWNGAWDNSFDETRGDVPSGTVTDVSLITYNANSYSALKFITDGTKPTVVRSFVTPDGAYDDESLTLSAVVEDTIEVYDVDFDAIVYPVGYTDSLRDATEQSDNLWTYSFSAGGLIAGYYCFKIVASDGANTNDLTEYAYLSLTVREAEILLDEISFFGVGNDFTTMTFSFKINKACAYVINEASASSPAADTWSGSTTEGMNNIAWPKLAVIDLSVNFTITFTNGTLTKVVNGQYAVAQTTFYVLQGPQTDSFTTVTLSGRISKLANYTIYTDGAVPSEGTWTGTISDLDFSIEFTKTGTEHLTHDFAVEFQNGTQTCWWNGSFYRDENDPDQQPGGGGGDYRQDPDWWQNMGLVILVLGVGFVVFKVKDGNLPNRREYS